CAEAWCVQETHAVEELLELRGLRDVFVEAGTERHLAILTPCEAGHRDRERPAAPSVLAFTDGADQHVSILTRHADVADQHIGRTRAVCRERLLDRLGTPYPCTALPP